MVVERFQFGPAVEHAAHLVARHLPAAVPELHPTRPSQGADREAWDAEDWLN
jgi:hypothetical protein